MEFLPGDFPVRLKAINYANIFFMFLYGILIPLQVIFLYAFITRSKEAMLYNNPNDVYSSLHWIFKQVVTGTILFGLNAVWAIIASFFLPGVIQA